MLAEARSNESPEGAWPHSGGMSVCFARGNTWHRCGKMNHFRSVCRSTATHSLSLSLSLYNASRGQYTRQTKVHTIEVDQNEHVQRTDMDDAYAFHVPTVAVERKPWGIRLCIDIHHADVVFKRERHPEPTLDGPVANINGAAVFSTIDMRKGYRRIKLEDESRHIITFSTHVGLRRYKRLIFCSRRILPSHRVDGRRHPWCTQRTRLHYLLQQD